MAKTMAFLAVFLELLLLEYFVYTQAEAKGGMKMSHWTGQQQTTASSPELFPNCRSKLECAVRCHQFSHCIAFTFDKQLRTCSLFPVQKPQESPGQSYNVFWNSDPVCQQTDIGNGTTSWNSTLTSLEGDVTCDTDFMYTSVDTAVRCHDNGAWEPPIGQCLQYYWRNTTGNFLLPRKIFPGWAMCAEGKPTANATFRLGTKNGTNVMLYWRIILFRSPTVTDRIKVKMDGDKSNAVMGTVQPFPFRVGQPFNISIVLLSADHTYSLIINGQEYSRRTSVEPISEVVQVYFDGDVELEYLNIWCV